MLILIQQYISIQHYIINIIIQQYIFIQQYFIKNE